LAYTPERWHATLRLTLACTAATVPIMMFKLHFPLLAMIVMYLLTKEETTATLVGTLAGIIGVTIGLGLALLVYLIALDITWLRVCLIPAFVGGGLFLNRVLVLGPLGSAIGLPAALAMMVPDIYPIPGILDRFLIWLWWSIVLGLGINLGVQLLLNPGNALDMLVQALSMRLQVVEASIGRRLAAADGVGRAGAVPAVSALALSGVANQLALLKMVQLRWASLRPYRLELHALIMCVDRLVTTAAALEAVGPVSLSAPVRGRLLRVAQACAQVRRALGHHHGPDAFVAPQETSATPEDTVVLPLLAKMERVLATIALAWPGRPSGAATGQPPGEVAPPRRLLVPDAFANPEYVRFALKGALAATLCYVIITAADVTNEIYTAVITCMVCSLSTLGASAQKGLLRFTGAVLGGTMGVVTCLYIFPHVDSLGGFWIPFSAGTAVAAYVNFGSPRISYCGYQIGLAFYKVVLQGYGPVTELRLARNRLVGIALGLVVFGVIDTQLWPVRAGATILPTLATTLRLLARLARLPGQPVEPAGLLSEADTVRVQIYQAFDTGRQRLEETKFEPGRVDHDVMAQLMAEAHGVFLTLLAVVHHCAAARPPGMPQAVRDRLDGLKTAVAESIEAVADRLDGKAEPSCADLAATLAEVEQTVTVSLAPAAEAASAVHVRGQLALYRALVPQVQHLLAPHSGLVEAARHEVL
jgi:multidrug resistance protein MdtO